MARIAGINLPLEKRIEIGLTYIHGIGRKLTRQILKNAQVSLDKKVKDLSENEQMRIREELKKYPVEGDQRRIRTMNIKRLQEIGAYRGIRHLKNLPVRGQRTKTNARTKKGKRVTIAKKKKETK